MARSEARVYTDIWTDENFLALTPTEQRAFLFVLSQIDLAHDGVISLRVIRWSRKAKGLTAQQLHKDIAGLAAAGFVVVDHETEELLIRSFIRRDKVYRQPNVLHAAADHLPLVESEKIRAALASEIRRVAELPDVHKDSRPILARMLESLDPRGETAGQNPQGNPSGNPSDDPSAGTPGVWGSGTAVTKDSPNPAPRDSEPHAPTLMSADALIPLATLADPVAKKLTPRLIAEHFNRFWEIYPKKAAKGDAEKAFTKAIKLVDPEVLFAAAAAYRDHGPRIRAEPKFTKHPATWLNQQCWHDELPADTGDRSSSNGRGPYKNPEDDSVYYESL